MSAKKKGYPVKDFNDEGTGESFTKYVGGDAPMFEAGAHAKGAGTSQKATARCGGQWGFEGRCGQRTIVRSRGGMRRRGGGALIVRLHRLSI